VVWSRTLGDGLRLLLAAEGGGGETPPGPGESPGPTPEPSPAQTEPPSGSPGPAATPPSGDVQALIEYANLHYELAQAALRSGDLATYGEEIELVGNALQELEALGASPAP